jgi:two-component system sensor histidine kinase UhpB
MALGHVPLGDLLCEVVRERARQHPELKITFTSGGLQPSYGEPIDLTIYRCVQESLTNTIRHARATRVDVTLGEAAPEGLPRQLNLQIRDDGRGIDPAAPSGRGLRGMKERVQALSGSCVVESASGGGTRVHIAIPAAAPISAFNTGDA